MKCLYLSGIILMLLSCGRKKPAAVIQPLKLSVKTPVFLTTTKEISDEIRQKSIDSLRSVYKIDLSPDSLLLSLTKQQNVKVIAKLETTRNPGTGKYRYSGGGFEYFLTMDDGENAKSNTVFFDDKKRISFKNYSITTYNEGDFRGEDFSFNYYNTLRDPEIIEVCGKRFLYSAVEHMCNGLGCSVNLYMIYDLETKRPVFIENFGITINGYFLSDFNDDNVPDLLLISKNDENRIAGLAKQEFLLTVFSLESGKFQRNRSARVELFGINSHEEIFPPQSFAITKNRWFK